MDRGAIQEVGAIHSCFFNPRSQPQCFFNLLGSCLTVAWSVCASRWLRGLEGFEDGAREDCGEVAPFAGVSIGVGGSGAWGVGRGTGLGEGGWVL